MNILGNASIPHCYSMVKRDGVKFQTLWHRLLQIKAEWIAKWSSTQREAQFDQNLLKNVHEII